MSFPKYAEYKDSGLDWLGAIPDHWNIAPLKRGFLVTLGKMLQRSSSSPDDELLPYLRAANIQWSGVDTSDIKQMWLSPLDKINLDLETDDLLVSEGGDVGRSCLWKNELEHCYIQNSVNRVRSSGRDSTQYLYYWMSTIKAKGYIDILCNKSTIAHFTAEKVAAVPVPFPPSEEQTAIANFLDTETAKIDSLVAEQRRLIELLKEKRQAVISHAVTKGLNPDAPLKDSGIQWLGEVPEHWEVLMISRVTKKITNGYVGPTREILVDEGLPYIQATHIKQGRIIFDGSYFVRKEWSDQHSKSILQSGDVLIVQTGAGTGDIGLVSENEVGFNCHALIILQSNQSQITGAFLAATLQSQYGTQILESIQTGGMHPHLNCGNVKFVSIPVPPVDEQKSVIEHINKLSKEYIALQNEAEKAIELLQERRTALISAAVTGKIDVRGYATQETA